ncbi:MAG: xanthine dehydrogenase family protein [Elusimicrobia bacterium]|nr:xanthine dehydrogenase family protein [Elusimicrobiota bacterium]
MGESAPRKDGPDKLCGAARYIDDHPIPGALFGVTVRSRSASGRIKGVRFDPSFPWAECVVADARDIPGKNAVHLLGDDQPLLADGVVRHAFEPVLLVGHPDRATAWRALENVTLEIEPIEPVLTMEDSVSRKRVIWGDDNVFKTITIKKGDAAAALAQAPVVVEGVYRVPHQEQAYIENQGMSAWFEEDGTLVVMGSLQCPYYVHKALQPIFALPAEKVRVIHAVTGGGFGGKEEYPNMLGGHAALLALKAKRPVKMIYDRTEDMQATTKRHPAVVRHRTGLTKDGRLLAQEIDILMDGGAYMTLSPVVLSRGILHATGPYECPNVSVLARSVATNTPPNGAFRGFGAPQTLFAAEMHWEKIASVLGKDPVDLRRRNAVKVGSVLATGQVLKESVSAGKVLETAVKRSNWTAARRAHARWNKDPGKPTWRGLGLSLVHHGAGFTGNGEVYLKSRAGLAIDRAGRVTVLAGSTEMGQGASSTLAQIAADALGVPYGSVSVERPDTARVPDSGPTVASRTTMVVGGLVRRAASDLRTALAKAAGRAPSGAPAFRRAARKLCGAASERRFLAEYERPAGLTFDDVNYVGDAYGSYGFAACAVELEVDRTTFEVRLLRVFTAQDVGKAVNPRVVEGQIAGGTVQGLGWALLEQCVYKDGALQNPRLTDYVIPTALDVPDIEVAIVEDPYSCGPFGAKGVGEMPMDPPGPAVAAAVFNATGLFLPTLPILPERIQEAADEEAARRALK